MESREAAEGVRSYWASMTKEQRSAEMTRRIRLGQRKRLAKMKEGMSQSPFPPEVMNSPKEGTIRQRLESLEAVIQQLKAELGF